MVPAVVLLIVRVGIDAESACMCVYVHGCMCMCLFFSLYGNSPNAESLLSNLVACRVVGSSCLTSISEIGVDSDGA